MQYETFKKAGYKFVCCLDCGGILLHNINGNVYEVFYANKNHASWGLKYKNTHLEYARTPEPEELEPYTDKIGQYEKRLKRSGISLPAVFPEISALFLSGYFTLSLH